MEKSKLLIILRSFSKQEIEAFTLFVESPYFNKNAAAVRLLKYLSKYHPNLEGTKVRKEMVFKKVYPKDPTFKEKRLNDLMTVLFKLCNDFLSFNHFKQDNVARAQHQFAAYNEKGFVKGQERSAKELLQQINTPPMFEEYHLAQYLLNRELFLNRVENDKPTCLQNAVQHLEKYYKNEKLFLAVLAKNREKYYPEKYNINTSFVKTDIHQEQINISDFLAKILEIQETEDQNQFEHLVTTFKGQKHAMSGRKAHNLLILILNIFLRKHRTAGDIIIPYIFELYRFAADEKFLTIDGQLEERVFMNICISAEIVGEQDWSNNFVSEYQEKIYPPENKQNILNITRASVLYERVKNSVNLKEIEKTIKEMNFLEFTEFAYTCKVKTQLIRLNYMEFCISQDFNSFEQLTIRCKAFENQLYRDTTTAYVRSQDFLNFSKFTKRLASYIYDNKREKLPVLKNQINKSEHVFAKAWLLKKVEEA